MSDNLRWKQRFENAYNVLVRMIERKNLTPDDEAVEMALIQSFEFTYELAWNTMKDYLEFEGFDNLAGSKQVIRTAFQAGLIEDAEGWLNAVHKRNIASHTYDENVLSEGVIFVSNDYFPLVSKLYSNLKVKF
ncbi:MAG: nucleotidyltransferase substrate binding protein [Chitinispirillales bacterium]|jgi:nucleotidyltransferase substrate binding protein (TIGR01987 family)|nr:nucleotidyltransferase substrate binding protein [Chitinispirillales bacterium]